MDISNQAAAKRRLIYILSPSFSGSTLLTLLLAQHPKIATIGELKATATGPIENYACSCGDLISDCKFWKQLQDCLNARNIKFSLTNFRTHFSSENPIWNKVLNAQVRNVGFELLRKHTIKNLPGLNAHFEKTISTNHEFIETTCHLMGADIFLDGSKDPHRLLYLLDSGLWDIYVIRMHRDGRGQSHSRRQKPRNPVNFRGAAKEWKQTIEQMNTVCKRISPAKKLTVKYEDLCATPHTILSDIWQFLNINSIDMNWSDIDLKTSEHHILGNRMRTKSSIQIKLDEKWRTELSEAELESFSNIAGKTNISLGYTDSLRQPF